MPDTPTPPPLLDPEVPGILGGIPILSNARWAEAFPGVLQGTTTAPVDFRLWGAASQGGAGQEPGQPRDARGPAEPPEPLSAWEALLGFPGVRRVVHGRQVHGASIRLHDAGDPGIHLAPPLDGHLTRAPGVLLAVTVADCVPVFILAPERPAVGLLHAGWRGSAAGILERGIAAFQDRFGVGPEELHLFLGASISRDRYETGPEVHRALGLPDPGGPAPLDLAGALAERAARVGVHPTRIARSRRCTHDDPLLHSHRGGSPARQVAFLAIREPHPS